MNVILITIDSLRYDRLSCSGYNKETTPVLDSLREKSIFFNQAYSVAPYTTASVLSLLTSSYPLMYGGYTNPSQTPRTFLTEVLKRHGYHTAAFHSNPWFSLREGYDRGFDLFYDPLNDRKDKLADQEFYSFSSRLFSKINNLLRRQTVCNKEERTQPFARGEELNQQAISWLKKLHSKFFLWIHYMDVHYPYTLPEGFFEEVNKKKPPHPDEIKRLNNILTTNPDILRNDEIEILSALYDGVIRYQDYLIGKLLFSIKKSGHYRESIIVITSDHGDEFKDHKGMGHGGGFRKIKMYKEMLHVPLLIILPQRVKADVSVPVSLLDVAPTILEILKIKKPDNFFGKSLISLVKKPQKILMRPIISEGVQGEDPNDVKEFDIENKRIICYRTAEYTYIYCQNDEEELYYTISDPKETNNIRHEKRNICRRLRQKVREHIRWEKKFEKPKIKYDIEIDLDNHNTSHTKIINLIRKNKKVLEFGCSTGYMSKELAKKGCQVTGVEIEKEAAEKAKRYCQEVIIGNIETIDYSQVIGKKKFDYLIFADVLEHLKDPKSVILKIKKVLKKNGKLFISVPNIAHASIRLELLTGDFEYEKLGILDETHLKYFTKKSIVRLLHSCGFYVEEIEAVSKGLTKETIKKFLAKLGVEADEKLIRVFNQPDALAYQYIIVASLNKPSNYSIAGVLTRPIKTINDSERQIKKLKDEIKEIYSSRGWKIISFLHRIRMFLPILNRL